MFTLALYADRPLNDSELSYKITKEINEFMHDYQKYGGSTKNINTIKDIITQAYNQSYKLKNTINVTEEDMYVKALSDNFNLQEFTSSQQKVLNLKQQKNAIMQKAYADILRKLDLQDREAIIRIIHDDDHTIASGANHD